jgi:uncharacterized repeat protein (TIGR01451 family)
VTKTEDAGTITPGSVAAFTVTVKNPRSLPTGPVSVADLVGVGGGYLVGAFADETDVVPGAVPDSLVIPSIPAGATYTLHFLVQTTSRPGTYGDTAEVMSSTDTTLDAKATSSVTTAGTGPPVKPPPLSITKTPDVTSVKRGGIVTYTITVSNPRSSDATNLLVTDGPLTGGVLDGIDPAADAIGVSCDAFRHSCTLGRLPAGQSFTVYVNVKATSSPVKNGATVLSKTDSTLDNKVTSSVTVTVHKR